MHTVGNNDRCGRCGARHGGNEHYCRVHGPVSAGCCATSCDPLDWAFLEDARGHSRRVRRSELPADASLVRDGDRGMPTFRAG